MTVVKIDVKGHIINPFMAVGNVKIAESGKSLRIEISDHPDTLFTEVYYVGREAIAQVLHGHRQSATVYMLKDERPQDPNYKDE